MIEVSTSDPSSRFLLLTPEQQEWLNQCLRNEAEEKIWSDPTQIWNTKPIKYTPENHRNAKEIAKIFPVRLRWFKLDRFGKYYSSAKKDRASHFIIRCRLSERSFTGDELT